ncbi:MAG: hypothetical protein GY855_00095, partial [candidate division Zixibacteria bacterium]|nr:hypothetical protein [candidate division Zixibacteria bacterium]
MSCFKNTIISSAIVLLFSCANNMTTEYVYANNLLLDSHKTLPNIPFITNKGQIDNEVKYYARIAGGTVFVTTGGELVYRFNKFTLK